VVSASSDGAIRLWDTETARLLRSLEGHTDEVFACAFSPDGARVISAGADRTVRLWEVQTGRELLSLEGHTQWIWSCAFSPDGTGAVSASHDKTVRLWDLVTGRGLRACEGHDGPVYACAFSPDGARVVSASMDRTLRLWDAGTGACLARLPLPGIGSAVAHHPARTIVACGDESGSVSVVDLVGVALSPLVLTAEDLGSGPEVFCPVCSRRHPIQEARLGGEIECPNVACRARLRVNSFIVRQPGAASWIRKLWRRSRT
jgi:WD40 repeat protein